jgi:hypothetical protein
MLSRKVRYMMAMSNFLVVLSVFPTRSRLREDLVQ